MYLCGDAYILLMELHHHYIMASHHAIFLPLCYVNVMLLYMSCAILVTISVCLLSVAAERRGCNILPHIKLDHKLDIQDHSCDQSVVM